MRTLLTAIVLLLATPAMAQPSGCPYDGDGDGRVDIEDLYHLTQNPADINGDGIADAEDTRCLEAYLRCVERLDMSFRPGEPAADGNVPSLSYRESGTSQVIRVVREPSPDGLGCVSQAWTTTLLGTRAGLSGPVEIRLDRDGFLWQSLFADASATSPGTTARRGMLTCEGSGVEFVASSPAMTVASSSQTRALVLLHGQNVTDAAVAKGVEDAAARTIGGGLIDTYTDTNGDVTLPTRGVLVLFELDAGDQSNASFAFDDAVLLVDVECGDVSDDTPQILYQVIVESGSLDVDGNTLVEINGLIDKPLIDQSGRVVFQARRASPDFRVGLFVSDGEEIRPLIMSGDVVPGSPHVTVQSFLDYYMNDAGDVMVRFLPVESQFTEAIAFIPAGGSPVSIIQSGSTSPYSSLGSSVLAGPHILVVAVSASSGQGLLLYGNPAPLTNVPLPPIGFNPQTIGGMSSSGTALVTGLFLIDNVNVFETNDEVSLEIDLGGPSFDIFVREDGVAPGTAGAVWGSPMPNVFSIADSGLTLFRGFVRGPGVGGINSTGIWLDSGAGQELIARGGDQFPNGSSGAWSFGQPPTLAVISTGDMIVAPRLIGAPQTLWYRSAATGQFELIADNGTPVPSSVGQILNMPSISMNALGGVLVRAALQDGKSALLYYSRHDRAMYTLAIEGVPLTMTSGEMRTPGQLLTYSYYNGSNTSDSYPDAMTDTGFVLVSYGSTILRVALRNFPG
ncbi:MAG: hypothetical protein RLN60_03995 [Phycisphaerales bacterium]